MLILNFKKTTKKQKQAPKKDGLLVWRIITFLSITILIVGISACIFFVYNNINLTLQNANTIFDLERKLGSENIDIKAYQNAIDYLDVKKTKITIPENLRFIFDYQNNVSSNTTTKQ